MPPNSRGDGRMWTWHERSARLEFLDGIERFGTEWAYQVVELGRQAMWCDRHDSCAHHVDNAVLGQTYRGEETLEQTYCRGLIATLICEGRVRRSYRRVGATPRPDRERSRNRRALRRGLSATPITAEVWEPGQGDPGEDGWVQWNEPLRVFRLPEAQQADGEPLLLTPAGAPLEIGYTLPSRTLGHLAKEGAVWRWPYNSELLWLVAAVDPTTDRDDRLRPLYCDYRWPESASERSSEST